MKEPPPPSSSSSRLRGFIKFEFPEAANSRKEMDANVEIMLKKLQSCLEDYGINIVSRQPTQIVEEQDCDCYFEVNYEVSAEHFDHNLIEAMGAYLNGLKGIVVYSLPSIILHSSDFWTTPLSCQVQGIPLSAILFGNLQGGAFINHWEISFWDEMRHKNRHSTSRDTPLHEIRVDFHFDMTDMISVSFQCIEEERIKNNQNNQNNQQNNNKPQFKKRLVNYQITVRRDSIRRIIIDPTVYDCYSQRTRIHFELNCPPLIRKGRIDEEHQSNPHHQPFYKRWKTFENMKWKNHGFPAPEAISDSPFFSLDFHETVTFEEIHRIISRLRARTKVSIEFGCHPIINVPIGQKSPYHRWSIQSSRYSKTGKAEMLAPTHEDAAIFREFLTELFPPRYEIIDDKEIDVNDERKFAITYLIECLLSRGAVVKDQILLVDKHWSNFLEIIIRYYRQNDKLCEAALEDLIHLIDGRKRIGCILKCLDRICQKRQRMQLVNGLTENEIRDGYQVVRKVVFTPTRVIYVAPETIMGNRVLRRYDKDGTRVLRITFRDDNNSRMRTNVTEELLEKTANKYLQYGIRVANRDFGFLGCSNSQMRDNGAYFMVRYSAEKLERFKRNNPSNEELSKYKPVIMEVRRHLGKFSAVENVPKMMARLGQCFTQSRLTGVELVRSDYFKTFDYEGGKNKPLVGDPYTFSDGVGMMSFRFAKSISQSMNLERAVPSCFQIRFRGMKGVIAIHPYLDELAKWAKRYDLVKTIRELKELKCVFRPSQIKFDAKQCPGDQIEMVKFASPVPVALNKPLINILDQVSEMQSVDCHRRMTMRIEELMDRQVQSFAKQMNDEQYCRNKLKEFPRRIDIDFLKTSWGFTLAQEPFFRSLIKASIKFAITKQLRKEQIEIPKELGRSMFGVVDETGRLQYGQVFVQYSKNFLKKLPTRMDNMKMMNAEVVTGTILLTKNPCIVPGDVRIFEAVDIPELHHMCDVVVFPQHGPRPHPDEMAGSDLDGDEYSVIWDKKMLLDFNEPAFDFSVEKKKIEFDLNKIDDLMREFYVNYLMLDSVGQISNAHLHNSDQYGLTSRVCMDLAKKNSQAVDFTKSGQPPEEMTRKWSEDIETGEKIPPENPERIPDFHMGNERNPQYVSPRLCGRLFREFQAIDNVIKISEEQDELYEIELDENITCPGYQKFMDGARTELANYNGQLRSIMETYGIATEGEIMSGCIIEMRNRISDKDQDDMSFFNTNQMIETRITTLVCHFRKKFFEEFGGFQNVCTMVDRATDTENVLSYRCLGPNRAVMQKAVAWYRACYEFARANRETRKLSFAWLAFDVIAKLKEQQMLQSDDIKMGGANPMYTFLEKHRKQYLIDHKNRFEEFKSFDQYLNDAGSRQSIELIQMYIKKHSGLDTVLFMLKEWAEASNLFGNDCPIRIYQFLMIFILYATGNLVSGEPRLFSRIDKNRYREEKELNEGNVWPETTLNEETKSRMMVKFLEYMSSRNFRKLPSLSFRPLGYSSIFTRGEWKCYHVAALKTYYNIMFNLRFEELPISTNPTITVSTVVREGEPFVIELPVFKEYDGRKIQELLESMGRRSGCEDVKMRPQSNRKEITNKRDGVEEDKVPCRVRYLVSAVGTLESLQRLRQLCAVTIPIRSHFDGDDVSRQMAFLTYHRIMNGF